MLTFYTEGPPHDAGRPLAAAEVEFRSLIEPFADTYTASSPRVLAADGAIGRRVTADYTEWLRLHPRIAELRKHNPGWARVGFQMWKPYLFLKTLASETVSFGDVLFYHDVDVTKYPTYRRYAAEWRPLSTRVLDSIGHDVYVPPGLLMGRDVKAWLIRRYLDDSYRTERGFWSGLVIARKSQDSLEFAHEWWALSRDLDNVSPLPNPNPYSEAIWHAPEQATLGVVVALRRARGCLGATWPVYALEHRAFGAASLRPAAGRKAAATAYVRGSLIGLRRWAACGPSHRNSRR